MYLKKGPEGAKAIMDVIIALRTKNLNFFKNTFNFYFTRHPPFPNSSMCYDVERNDYKFISNTNFTDFTTLKLKNYVPGDPDTLIKDHTFLYDVIEPHNVIIANAEWIYDIFLTVNKRNIEAKRDEAAETFYNWYKREVNKEYNIYKNILLVKEPKVEEIKIRKLF